MKWPLSAKDEQRFLNRVLVSSDSVCWNWVGRVTVDRHGEQRGKFTLGGREELAHRVAYVLSNNCVPALFVLHTCGNTLCCNPKHLYEGTQKDNVYDSIRDGTHVNNQPNPQRFSVKEIRLIRELYITTKQVDIARQFNVDPSTISKVIRRKRPYNV